MVLYDWNKRSGLAPNSMQLVAGRIAQSYNKHKQRKGAFWEDRYHATAVQSDEHFIRCLLYIDMNMVCAGVVRHPENWPHCGYHEIQQPRTRYRIIDRSSLLALTNIELSTELSKRHYDWVNEEIKQDSAKFRDERWTQGLAVGQREFVEQVQTKLGYRAKTRECIDLDDGYLLKEPPALYLPYSSEN